MRRSLLQLNLAGACIIFSNLVANSQSKASISGLINDSAGKAVPYATISLFKSSNLSIAFRSNYTDNTGSFKLMNIDTEAYSLVITSTSFGAWQKKLNITEASEQKLGTIVLKSTAGVLKGITITVRKPLIEMTDDKITYNAENDPAAKAETAIDILKKTPYVTVDGDNNIQVNGQSSFKILLNGRETSMFAQNLKDALKGFPGALISKVEVITNPSSKYDAEGVGGVINIITKKKVAGYNGSVSSYYSTTNNFSESLNLNIKYGKVGVSGYYSMSGGSNIGSLFTETVPLVPSVFTKRTVNGSSRNNYFFNSGNVEVSVEVDSLNIVTGYGNLSGGNSSNNADQDIITDYTTSAAASYFQQDSRSSRPSYSIGSDYIRKFKGNKEKEFTIRVNGDFSINDVIGNSEQGSINSKRFVLNNSKSRNREFTLQSDYSVPLANGKKIETGIKAILRKANSDFSSFYRYDAATEYILNRNNTNLFSYHQEVVGAYGSYNFKIKDYTFRLGTRVEATSINADFSSSNTVVDQSYFNVVPNFQLTRKWNPTYTTILSYNMRLQRPYITNLNPFVNNNDSLNIYYGNPNLGPQYTHSVALQNRINKGKTFLGVTLTGFYSNKLIVQFAQFNKQTGVTATSSANLGEEYQASLSVNASTTIDKLTLWTNAVLRYNSIKSLIVGYPERAGLSGNWFNSFSYKFTPKFTLSGSGGINRTSYTILSRGNMQGFYQVNFGYKFLKDKLSTTVNFNNFFYKNMGWKMIIDDPSFRTTNLSSFPYRVIYFGATYSFGKLTENVSKKKGVSNDDLL